MAKRKTEAGNLSIGDVVLLCYNADSKQHSEVKKRSGLVIADLSGVLSEQHLIVQPTDTEKSSLSTTIQYGTFRVLVANKYEAQTRYKSLKDKLNEVKRKKVSESATQLLQLQVDQAKQDRKVEEVENAARQARLKGSSVRYGDTVQLQHMLTGKYIGVSTTHTSVLERSKLMVSLQLKDSIGCIFRLHPHIKVQTVGEEVNFADQIKFESVASECQYLHCSAKTFGDMNINVYSECFELNLAANDTPLEIVQHYQPSAGSRAASSNTLKSNGIIRLFHRKHFCYLVGDGSYAGQEARNFQGDDQTPENTDIRKQSHTICSTLRRASKSLSKSISEEIEFESSLQDFNSMKRTSITSAISSIPEVDSLGFSASDNGVIFEDVHFRKKRSTGSLSLQPSDSPITFWQIVKYDNPNSGEPMRWYETCRIMHLPSRQYLAVEAQGSSYKVTLKSSSMSKSATMFELFPAVQQVDGEIDCDSFVRIKHMKTMTWLHLNKDIKYQRTSSVSNGNGLQEARQLFQVNATTEINSDDAFALENVELVLIADFKFISSITTVLSKQLQQCARLGIGEPHSPLECNMGPALLSLQHLHQYMRKSSDKKTLKLRQKIIRSLKTLEITVNILNLHKNGESYDQEVCTACFDIITSFLEGSSNKNKMYLSVMINQIFSPTIWDTELLDGKTVEKALIGIAKDNLNLLYEAEFTKHVIQHLVDKLAVTSKNSKRAVELLRGLSVFCTYQGVPIKKNQLKILKLFQQSSSNVLYSLRINTAPSGKKDKNGSVVIQMEDCISGKLQYKYSQTLPVNDEEVVEEEWRDVSLASKNEMTFLLAELHLLKVLSQGNNEEVIKTLQGQEESSKRVGVELPFQTVMLALYDSSIMTCEPRIRARLLELLIVMFVDVGGNRPYLEKFPLSFKLKEMGSLPFESAIGMPDDTEETDVTGFTGIKNSWVPDIKLFIKTFIKKKENYLYAADENGANEVVAMVLQLVSVLLKFGYYRQSKETKRLLPMIFSLLDGKEDYPSKVVKETLNEGNMITRQFSHFRRRSTRQNSMFTTPGSRIARDIPAEEGEGYTLELDIGTAQKMLNEFRDKGGRYAYEGYHHFNFEIKHWALVVLNLLFNLQLLKSLHYFIHDYRWLSRKADPNFNTKGTALEDLSLNKPAGLRSDLAYLLSHYPWDPSYGRYNRNRARSVAAIAGYRLKCIIEKRGNPDLSNDNQLPEILLDLMQYQSDDLVQYSLLLLDRHFTTRAGIFDKALNAQILVSEESVEVYDKIDSLLTELAAFLKSRDASASMFAASSPIEVLKDLCWLKDEAFGYEPNQTNQRIILSFGILSDVLKYIVVESSNILIGNDENKGNVIACFNLLRGLASRNEEVKMKLLQHVDLFLKMAHRDMGPHVGILLREIFEGSPAVCLAIKEIQIQKMISVVFVYENESAIRTNAALVDSMICLLVNKDLNLPLSYCQKLVSRNFSIIREDDHYWCHTMLQESNRSQRMSVLKSENPTNPDLVNLLLITDLLATSAFGENSSALSICCTIFTEEELVEIISCPEIDCYRKRPFLKFFTWVYVNLQGSQKDKQYKSYSLNRVLWSSIDAMVDAIKELSGLLKNLPMSTYFKVKELLIDPSWKYLHNSLDEDTTEIQVEINVAPSFAVPTGTETRKIADYLAYFCEGILPFMNIFFKEFGSQITSLEVNQKVVAASIYSALKDVVPFLQSDKIYFSDEMQVKTLYRAFLVLEQFKLDTDETFVITSAMFKERSITAARKIYIHRYSSEAEENVKFQTFVHNYQAANQGKNTQRHQLTFARKSKRVSNKQAYSEFTDDEMLRPGVKYLPLGRSFQEFVSIFGKKDNDLILGLALGNSLGDTLGNTLDLATRTLNNLTTISDSDGVVEKKPRGSLIKQLEISLVKNKKGFQQDGLDAETQAELDIKCLQILRATIYNEIIQINEGLKQENPNKFRKHCDLYLHPVQNEIHSLGNQVSTYLALLSHPNERIVNEVLAFLDVLLENADRSIQEGFNNSTRMLDQDVFPTLQSMMRRVSVLHNERHELIRKTESRDSSDHRLVHTSVIQAIPSQGKKSSRNRQVQERSRLDEDGALVISRRRQGALFANLFRRTNTTRVVLVGGNKRIPFQAIFKVNPGGDTMHQKELDLLQTGDISRVTLVSKVLSLICDGQFREMQHYLREQSESLHSINMVAELTSFLHQLHRIRSLSFETLELFSQLLQALVEMCSGNFSNCEVVFNANILSVLNYIFQIDVTEIKESWQSANEFTATVLTNFDDLENIAEGVASGTTNSAIKMDYTELRKGALKLKGAAVELLKVMMEKITSRTESLVHQIAGGLDINALQWSMVDFYVLKDDKAMAKLEMAEYSTRALFMTYNIFMDLHDNKARPLKALEPSEKEPHKAWEFCAAQSRKVEIVYVDEESGEEVLTNMHFNLKLESEISEAVKESLKYEVDRTTYGNKMRDFQKWMVAVKKDTLYRDWLKKKHLHLVSLFSFKRYWLLLFLTLVLNIIVLVSFRSPSPDSPVPSLPVLSSDIDYQLLIYIIGGVHSFFSVWMVLEYFMLTAPHFVLPELLYRVDLVPDSFSQYKLTAWMKRIKLLPRFNRTYSSVNIVGPTTVLVVVFLACSVLSLFFKGYFYCVCLLYVIINNDILQRVLRSVTKNGKSLLWMAILLLIILFIYSILSFAFFQRDFQATGDFHCDTLDQCFVSVIRNGLLGSFLSVSTASFAQTRGRFFFDLSFFIIVSTIGLNVVFGIILDSYNELRNKRYYAEKDMTSSCFICDLQSYHFEKLTHNGFEHHVKQDHNMWAYIHLSIYLDLIDVNNHHALEQYIYKKISEGKTDYLPYNKAIVLEGVEDDGAQLKKDIQKIMDEQYYKLTLRLDAIQETYEAQGKMGSK